MSDSNEIDLYNDAVGDATSERAPTEHEDALVVESNASNYGASAVTPQHVLEEDEEEEA